MGRLIPAGTGLPAYSATELDGEARGTSLPWPSILRPAGPSAPALVIVERECEVGDRHLSAPQTDLTLSPPGTGMRSEVSIERELGVGDRHLETAARLEQGQLSDCFLIASLNEIAGTPGGMDHLRSRIKDVGSGFYEVRLRDDQGSESTVLIRDPRDTDAGIPAKDAPATGDHTLRVMEKAMAVHNDRTLTYSTDKTPAGVYKNSDIDQGGDPATAMYQLGLDGARSMSVEDTLRAFEADPSRPTTFATQSSFPAATRPYGLVTNHAYQVDSTYQNAKGETMVVLSNPWGIQHPQHLPARAPSRLFQYGSQGRIPR
jgi:hypothetical protein